MAVSEQQRHEFFEFLRGQWGAEQAGLLMAMLPPAGADELVTRSHLAETTAVLRAEMAELRTDLRTEMAELRTELRTEAAGLRSEMVEMRSELRTDMAELRTDLDLETGLASVRGEMHAEARKLSSEVSGLEVEMQAGFRVFGATMRSQTRTIMVSMVGMFSTAVVVAFTAARFGDA